MEQPSTRTRIRSASDSVTPIDQLRRTYLAPNRSETLREIAHRLFSERNGFGRFTDEFLSEAIEAQRVVLSLHPRDGRLRYELAFLLVQHRPTAESLAEAAGLLATPSPTRQIARLTSVVQAMQTRVGQPRARLVRANYALNNACPQTCLGCYHDFGGAELDDPHVAELLGNLGKAGFQELVVSGGDPLLSCQLPFVLETARANGLRVGVDTTGYTMTVGTAEELAPLAAYVGLPIDGTSDAAAHSVRRSRGRDALTRALIAAEICESARIPVKINTILCRANLDTLADIAHVVSQLPAVQSWSIFQWSALRATAELEAKMGVTQAEAEDAVSFARPIAEVPVRYHSTGDRDFSHFFVESDGRVVTFGSRLGETVLLGKILEDPIGDILDSPALRRDSEKGRAAQRFEAGAMPSTPSRGLWL